MIAASRGSVAGARAASAGAAWVVTTAASPSAATSANGGWPAHSSNSSAPSEYTSLRRDVPWPAHTSGAM
jgi:hypothetical protein